MGIKVSATLNTELKPSYTVATVLAAAFTCADADLCIWIGNAHGMNKLEEIIALKNCAAHIRENGTVTPTTVNESYAETATALKSDINSAFNSAIDSALTGTVSVTASTAAVTGVGTAFTTELAAGDAIKIGSEIITILSIASDTALTLSANHVAGAAGATAYLVAVPQETKVGIWYGPDFQQNSGSSIAPFVARLIEVYLETTQKAA